MTAFEYSQVVFSYVIAVAPHPTAIPVLSLRSKWSSSGKQMGLKNKRYDVKSVNLADSEKVRHCSASRSRRINPRVHLHHKLFTFSKFCFLKIVQGCQISKVSASFSAQRSQSRQPVDNIFPLDGVGVVQRDDDTTE